MSNRSTRSNMFDFSQDRLSLEVDEVDEVEDIEILLSSYRDAFEELTLFTNKIFGIDVVQLNSGLAGTWSGILVSNRVQP